jgi:hypothetical protein
VVLGSYWAKPEVDIAELYLMVPLVQFDMKLRLETGATLVVRASKHIYSLSQNLIFPLPTICIDLSTPQMTLPFCVLRFIHLYKLRADQFGSEFYKWSRV